MVDAVFGLPLHPLVVHAVVVLLPLVALAVIALVLMPRWRARFAVPLLGLLVVGAVSAVVAMLAGEASPSPPPATPSPSVEPTDSTATPSRFGSPPATTTTGDGPITMATVEANATADSCWAAIDGFVYDLTDWIARHPGGPDRILALCGTDATAAFTAQHDGDAPPTAQLELLRLGPLA